MPPEIKNKNIKSSIPSLNYEGSYKQNYSDVQTV